MIMDFWVLGVIASLVFLVFVWLVVWVICCLLGILLCRWLIMSLRSASQPQAQPDLATPTRRRPGGWAMIRQWRLPSWLAQHAARGRTTPSG